MAKKLLDKVTLAQAYQGARGIPALVTETSLLDANEGIRFRGFSIPELARKAAKGGRRQGALPGRPVLPDAYRRAAC